ncbi:Glycosyltransferase family 92 protein [Aphelenchoides besseyi]|nr:Glycosyltransferase family 92 protein [Aphelenchoides besseyi]KAI6195234.1 Glycosyltransferase family 92 protein [Aphelenchoides besseyi]
MANQNEFPSKLPFRCSVFADKRKYQRIRPIIRAGGGDAPECRWSMRIVDCPLNAGMTELIQQKPLRSFDLIGSATGYKHKVEVTQPATTSRSLVVCFSNLFRYEQWPLALATVELYLRYGADLLVIPIASVLLELYTVLETYEQNGQVQLKPAVVVPWMRGQRGNPSYESAGFHHILTYTECLYEFRESADFILNVDMDDIVLPSDEIGHGDLLWELQRLAHNNPTAAAFEFSLFFATTSITSIPQSFSIGRMLEDVQVDKLTSRVPYGRFVIRPSRLRRAFIKSPHATHDLLPSYDLVRLDSDHRVTALRFRPPGVTEFEWKQTSLMPTSSHFGTNRTYFNEFDQNFSTFLENNSVAKQEFYKLPTTRHRAVAAAHSACYAEVWRQLDSHDTCPSLLKCLDSSSLLDDSTKQIAPPVPCILMTTLAEHTRMRGNLFVDSLSEISFREHQHCHWNAGKDAGLFRYS